MARRIAIVGSLFCLLVLSENVAGESLTFRRAADGRFLAAIDGYSDGPGCAPQFLPAASIEIIDDAITISSPADEGGCFIPRGQRPYEVLADLGMLSGARYDVTWTQPGMPVLEGVLESGAVGNLVPNGDFDEGLDGWSPVDGGGSFTVDDAIGVPDAPSLHLTSGGVQSSCIAIDAGVLYDLYVLARSDAGTAAVLLQPYSDASCTTMLAPGVAEPLESSPYWQTLALGAAPPRALSVRIVLTASPDALGAIPDVHFDHVRFGQTGSVPVGIPFSQEGLTGTWYDTSTSGQGFQFVISNDDTFGALRMFGAWYTYDVAGNPSAQRWYSLQSIAPQPTGPVAFAIYENTGGNFATQPDTSAVLVGGGSLVFQSCTAGLLTYAFANGSANSIPIHRLLPNVACDVDGLHDAPVSDFGLSGAWYDPDVSGQGVIIEVNPENAQMFVGWYTYSLGTHAQRWFSAQGPYTVGSRTMQLTLYDSTGGTFIEPGGVTTLPVGTATLTFPDCTDATLAYAFTAGDMTGQTGTIALTRLGTQPASCGIVE